MVKFGIRQSFDKIKQVEERYSNPNVPVEVALPYYWNIYEPVREHLPEIARKITPKKSEVFYAIYQQLGLLWEFLGCLCKHWDGHKKKGDRFLCKICGKVKGSKED